VVRFYPDILPLSPALTIHQQLYWRGNLVLPSARSLWSIVSLALLRRPVIARRLWSREMTRAVGLVDVAGAEQFRSHAYGHIVTKLLDKFHLRSPPFLSFCLQRFIRLRT